MPVSTHVIGRGAGIMNWRKNFVIVASVAAGLAGCQSPGHVGSIDNSVFNTPSGVQPVATAMPAGQQVTAPLGYIGFCTRNPGECAGGTDTPRDTVLSPEGWAELNQINNFVNNSVPQISDMQLYERSEWWAYPDARGGDCEDLALMKRKLLIERGWALENLLIAVVREQNGDGHAVLLVKTDRGEFVLDNKNPEIAAWQDAPYRWIKRQSRERPFVWVNLDRSTFRDKNMAEMPPLGQAAILAAIEKKKPVRQPDRNAESRTASRNPPKEKPTAALEFD